MPSLKTLRPSGRGDITGLTDTPSPGNNWEKVDESSPDADSTYVWFKSALPSVTSDGFDLYALPDQTASGEIYSVKVYVRGKKASPLVSVGNIYTLIKTNTNTFFGSSNALSTSYSTVSTTYTTNPQTGSAWTWDEINALQVGVKLETDSTDTEAVRCTQVYVEVSHQILAGLVTLSSGRKLTIQSGSKLVSAGVG